MKRILPVAILVFLLSNSWAQQEISPGQTLRLARSTYEQGRLNEVVYQLKEEFFKQSSITKSEKVEGYKILCLTYIYLEEPEKADEAMLNILSTDPYFQINPAVDPAEFVALYKTFRTAPIYRIGAKLGVNATQPNVTESVAAVELASGSEYKYLVGFQFGAAADLPISKKLTLHGDLLFLQRRFDIKLRVDRGTSEAGEPLINLFQGNESQTWLSLPITLEYEILNKKYHPYVAGGFAVDYLLGSTITSERSREDQTSIQEKNYDFSPQRQSINFSMVGAAGVKLRMGGGFFVAEARFIYGLTTVSTKENSYKNTQYALEQGYADPVYKLTSVAVTVSYVQNIFSPKKLTKKK